MTKAKSAKARKQHHEASKPEEAPIVALKVGDWQFPAFDGLSAAFGADGRDYPPMDRIPDEFMRGHTPFNKVVSTLFFKGGSLADFSLQFKPDIDRRSAMTAIRALLCSFAPKHEVKEATVAWCLSEWTVPTDLPA
jgi:hypothetical protein